MPHTITAKLNENAREFQAGESTGFGFRLGERYYDRETKKSEYTNYEGAIFSKNQSQIDFLRSALIEGAVLSVSCDQLKITQFTTEQGNTYLKNQMQNCRLDNVYSGGEPSQKPDQQQSGNSGQSPAQQAPAAQPQSYGSFTTDWTGYKPSASTNGATLDQVKKKYNGDLQAAIKNGHVEKDFDAFDDQIPF